MYIADTGGELARWLGRANVRAAVVRPDRTVMCAGRDAAALCARVPTFAVTTPAYDG